MSEVGQKNGVVTDLPNQIKHQVEVTLANRSVANQNKKQHLSWDKETKTDNKRVITIKHGMLMQSTIMGLKQCFFFLLSGVSTEWNVARQSPPVTTTLKPLKDHRDMAGNPTGIQENSAAVPQQSASRGIAATVHLSLWKCLRLTKYHIARKPTWVKVVQWRD